MSNEAKRVGIYTLGCKVNQYESQAIAEEFETRGYSILPAEDICDVYVINTCTVTAESDRKARQFIRRAHSQKSDAVIIVTGCYAQTAEKEVAKIEGVDYICGNTQKLSVVDAADRILASKEKSALPICEVESIENSNFEKMSITRFDRTRAYVKIEDGCESRCTYCIIPKARGSIRSKLPSDVLDEVKTLVDGGCQEIVLTGIETASYGKDLDGVDLASLLCKVDKVDGIKRVRLGSLDPSLITEDFTNKIKGLKCLAPHFHLSLQSGSDRVLALMKRKYNSSMAMRNIKRLREAFPNAHFTTDVIVGFPGETEEDFEKTIEFAKEAAFLKIHIFPYSKREGTPAASMSGQIEKQVKHARLVALSHIDAEVRKNILKDQIKENPVCEVLFESFADGIATGHTASFIEVCAPSDIPLHSSFRQVRLLSTNGDVCFGEIIKEEQNDR